jgi:monofunctional glycosyltransferase
MALIPGGRPGAAVSDKRQSRRPHRARRPLRSRLVRLLLILLVTPGAIIIAYRHINPPITPLMVIRMAQGEGINKHWVPLEQISPHLARAAIASEDNLFCTHFGFDVLALRQQMETFRTGGRPRGASTITMQVAKNILLWPGRDPVRKVIEAGLTPQIELFWSKQRILEVYLNVVELGPGLYGVEAAARTLFGKPASTLSRDEAARLVAILPNPREWSAVRPGPIVRARVNAINRRIDQLGPLLDCARSSRGA